MNKYQEALNIIVEQLKLFHSTKRGGGKTYLQGKINIIQELVDKEIPKKAKIINHSKLGHSYATHCPNCNERIVWEDKRCWDCGQVLDWSNNNE